ncbi:MAG: hypothetical protein LBE38_10330 [Deltaproteobacteria bacterium]|nr:hypothetical protein [Deltaproteobacteria bacterium]
MNNISYPVNPPDLSHCENLARLLAKGLSTFSLSSDPLDVAETLEQLGEEMEDMPLVIQDCRLAMEAFKELESVLDRMYALADRAVELNDSNPRLMAAMNEEFSGYAHIVARLAGADDFDGPCLTLETSSEARVTRIILGYLAAAKQNFAARLEEQRRHINAAMDDAIGLLARILEEGCEISYDTRKGLTDLLGTLKEFGGQWDNDSFEARPYLLH